MNRSCYILNHLFIFVSVDINSFTVGEEKYISYLYIISQYSLGFQNLEIIAIFHFSKYKYLFCYMFNSHFVFQAFVCCGTVQNTNDCCSTVQTVLLTTHSVLMIVEDVLICERGVMDILAAKHIEAFLRLCNSCGY